MSNIHLLSASVVLAGVLSMQSSWSNGAGTPLDLSFEQAVRMAGEKPASVVMSHERVQQAVARLAQTRTNLFPQVSATASESRQTRNLAAQGITIPGQDPLIGPFNTFDARLKLTQALFDAETLEGLKFARTGRDLALMQKRKSQQDTMSLVATLYIQAKRAQDAIALGNVLKTREEKELALARSQVSLGTGSQMDAEEAGARLADSERFLTAAQAQAEERRLDLAAALDFPVNQPIVFEDSSQLPPPDTMGPLNVESLESHPDVAVARESLAQKQAQEGVIKSGYAPKVSASADYGASGKLPSDSVGTYTVGGQLQESQTQLEDVRIQTQAKAKSAAEAVKSSWAAVQARKSASDVANTELELARHKLRLGVGTDLEFTEQEAKAAQASDNWDEAVATYQMARVTLAQSRGKMESLEKP
jgi:outer membrane protein